jgi:hypothetical protein
MKAKGTLAFLKNKKNKNKKDEMQKKIHKQHTIFFHTIIVERTFLNLIAKHKKNTKGVFILIIKIN